MICHLFPEPTYLFLSPEVSGIFYYAHIPVSVIALAAGLLVFLNGRQFLLNRLLFAIAVFFSLWTLANLIVWTNIRSDVILLAWSFFGLLAGLISIFCIYFIYVFLGHTDVSVRIKTAFLTLLAPLFALTPTSLNVGGFNITRCDAFEFEGYAFELYYTALGVLAMIWILVLLARAYRTATPVLRKQIALVGTGIELFLFSFFVLIFLASYLTEKGILPDSEMELYGLFGMAVFVVYIGVLTVRFETFNVKIFAAQALVAALAVLTGSQIFFVTSVTSQGLVVATFCLVLTAGWLLWRSVKKEIRQREEIQRLSDEKSEFIAFASHEIRNPITAIRGYASLMYDGTTGDMSPETREAAARILVRGDDVLSLIAQFLSKSKVELGKVSYTPTTFDCAATIANLTDDFLPHATARGLTLEKHVEHTQRLMIRADETKLREVVGNIIDNAIKYTKEGGVTVSVERHGVAVRIIVADTGPGIPADVLPQLFKKFSRADAQKANLLGTGVGLYLGKTFIEGMGGHIWAESPGPGSRFIVEFPAIESSGA